MKYSQILIMSLWLISYFVKYDYYTRDQACPQMKQYNSSKIPSFTYKNT